jgi:hypothetical protein
MAGLEEWVEVVGRAITRRRFLTKLGAAVLGMATAWIRGLNMRAYAVSQSYGSGCCHLCLPPGSAYESLPSCAPRQPYRTKWCWYCVDSRGFSYKCCEAYEPNVPEGMCGGCIKVFASWYVFLGPHRMRGIEKCAAF